MSPGLAYVVVRCHAMRGELLAPEVVKALALADGMRGFLELLSKTSYRKEMGEWKEGTSATELERFFNQSFARKLERIIRVCPQNLSEFLQTYYYMRFEIHNLKRILRGKFSKLPAERIRRLIIPLQPYSTIAFEKLLTAEDLEDFVDLLRGTPYAPLEESLVLCQKYDVIWPLEVKLNYLYLESVQGALSKIPSADRGRVKRMVEIETDVENLLLAINWRGAEKELPAPEGVFQHTYGFSSHIIKELIECKDLGEVIMSLEPPYAEIFKPLLEQEVALVRTNLHRYLYEAAKGGEVRNDFGFPCLMSYLISYDAERGDLMAIAWGKEQGVDPKRILTYSILPSYAP